MRGKDSKSECQSEVGRGNEEGFVMYIHLLPKKNLNFMYQKQALLDKNEKVKKNLFLKLSKTFVIAFP